MRAAELKDWNSFSLVAKDMPRIHGDEALIRVRYGGICGSDLTVYRGLHPTARAPVVLCHEILGVVEQLPDGYEGEFRPGDRALINPVISCGTCAACRGSNENVCANLKLLGIHIDGGFAEYTKASVKRLIRVPHGLADEIAALGEPFAVSCHVNRRAEVKAGDKVLVIGAGFIGIVVALGALESGAEVYISEVNPERQSVAKNYGIPTTSPRERDISEFAREVTSGAGFDVVIDTACTKGTAMLLPDLCRIRGRILFLGLSRLPYEFLPGVVSFREQTLIGSRLYLKEDFESGVRMLEKIAQQRNLRGLISDIYPLDQILIGFDKALAGKNAGKILIDCR